MSEKCQACGRFYDTVYRVPDDVWAQIAPREDTLGPYAEHQGGGLLCVDCAWTRAREKGITLYFEGTPGWWGSDSQPTEPPPSRRDDNHEASAWIATVCGIAALVIFILSQIWGAIG
ncbi:MAG TPA: hypothetical protein VK973_05910 [Arenicellales bacterium]|nr:hypothetical protein [Arenicellales bacterium]